MCFQNMGGERKEHKEDCPRAKPSRKDFTCNCGLMIRFYCVTCGEYVPGETERALHEKDGHLTKEILREAGRVDVIRVRFPHRRRGIALIYQGGTVA